MMVVVLLIRNKYGDDVYVCTDFSVACRQLEQYVDEQWDENMAAWGRGAPKPEDVDERIQDYFNAACARESYEFFSDEPVIGLGVRLPYWAWNTLSETLRTAMRDPVVSPELREKISRALQAAEVIVE